MKVKTEMKTPARRRLKQDLIAATPTITPLRVPAEAKLGTRRKQKVPVFKDSDSQDHPFGVVSTPVAPSVHATRMTRAMARRAMKTSEPAEDNRAGTASDDEPEEAVHTGPAGDFLALSPIKNEENDNAESVRLQRFHSRPVSPITAEVNSVFNTHTPIQPLAPSASDEAILDEALLTAREFGDMETIRAILNLRIGEIIRKQQVAEKSTIILSDSAKLGELHGDVVGIGALIDTEFGCQLRLSNNITAVPERNQKKALDMVSSVNATDDFFREQLEDAVVIVSLIPDVSKTLHCSYENCLALVTRLEPNGAVLSVAFDGSALASEALRMRHTVDMISEELSKEVTDPNQWWETRAKRNDYCHQLWTSKLPDVLGPALPLFTFPKAITWPKEAPQPKIKSSRALYLNYAVRAWSFMNTLAKTNVAGIVNIRKVELDKLVKAHTFVEMQYQRTTSTYLVLGRLVQTLCFERMPICKGLRMSRMMSIRHAEYLLRTEPENRCVDICDVLYVVDSQTNLAGSAETVGKFFQGVKEWDGYTSIAPPSNELIKKLNEKSLYIFAGHGSGSDCVGGWGRVVRKGVSSTMHLIGCGSGRLRDDGRTEPRGAVTKILDSGCESVLAMLWSVTDRDIDRFTLRLYADWFSGVRNSSKEPGPCISRYINEAARACKLGAANAGACVNYGLIPTCYNIPENWDLGLPAKINYK